MSARASTHRPGLRATLVFLVAFAGLCLLAGGGPLSKPSANNHFSHLASGWLAGRLHHEGRPPGYRKRRYDDWAVLYNLTLSDGTTLRGYPCKTAACSVAKRERRVSSWIVPGEPEPVEIERGTSRRDGETWYISFPPGPGLIFAPFVALWGIGLWDVLLTCFLGALIPVVLLRLLDRERGLEDGKGRQHLWWVAAWTFGSPACFVAAHGSVWFTAQIVGTLFLTLYLSMAWRARRPALAGLCLGMAVASRPFMLLALPFFTLEWLREGRRPGVALRFLVPLGVIGGALAAHNYVRFEDVFEFGHRYLDVRWQVRMQEMGMFSTTYLGRNLRCLFTLLPQIADHAPYLKVSMHGVALTLSTPWILASGLMRSGSPQSAGLVLSALLVGFPALLYQNSGQLQFSYRFALDWLPLLLLFLAFGGIARRRVFAALVVLAMAAQIYGAYQFSRAPGDLFVTKPPLWPFEHELDH